MGLRGCAGTLSAGSHLSVEEFDQMIKEIKKAADTKMNDEAIETMPKKQCFRLTKILIDPEIGERFGTNGWIKWSLLCTRHFERLSPTLVWTATHSCSIPVDLLSAICHQLESGWISDSHDTTSRHATHTHSPPSCLCVCVCVCVRCICVPHSIVFRW